MHDRRRADLDLVIEQLADEQIVLEDQIVHLTADRDAYRELALQAIHALHALTAQHERFRETHRRLLDEYHDLRVRVMHEAQERAA